MQSTADMGMNEGRERTEGCGKVAVIVPFWNAADTLPRLVAALKAQTYPQFTAFFVDDGSTDGGRAYMDGIAGGDSRFKVLKGNHSGPGPARNVGLDASERLGFEYVTFADADDIPLPAMLEEAVAALDGSDADIVHYQWCSEPGGEAHRDSRGGKPAIYVWNKTYRLSAIAGIRFIDAKFSEDLAFYLETEARRPRRRGICHPLYCHVCRSGSLWESRSPEDVAQAVRAVIGRIDPIMRTSHFGLRRQWQNFYMVKLLKLWKKDLRRILRENRDAATEEYLRFVSGIRFPTFCALGFRFRHLAFLVRIRTRNLLSRIRQRRRTADIRRKCALVRRRMASYPADRKLRVLFHVTDISKWKCQTAYDRLKASTAFEPAVLVDLAKPEYALAVDDRNATYAERRKWFADRGMDCVDGYDVAAGREIDLKAYSPDILFYQQPWGIRDSLSPFRASGCALTCYVPYFTPNYHAPEFDCGSDFYRDIAYYMVMSESIADAYRAVLRDAPHVCELVSVGHPALDPLMHHLHSGGDGDRMVIYAPHWTFHAPMNRTARSYGTFEWSGEAILDFAERHPEIRWCFKPHPLLRGALVASGLYSEEQSAAYFCRWERVGVVCMDADYAPIFHRSSAMVTDSASFLTEYSVTGKPIVHLWSSYNNLEPIEGLKELYGTFYRAKDKSELMEVLNALILRGMDINADIRADALRRAGIADGRPSSERIVEFLERHLRQRAD